MKLSKVISIFICIALIAVVVAVAGVFVGYLNKGQKSFFLQNGDVQIYSDNDRYSFKENTYYYFDVKNSLGFTKEQVNNVDYSLKVVLSPATLISHGYNSYTYDNHLYTFSEEIDCTEYFIVNEEESSFVFRLAPNLTLRTILENYHDSTMLTDVPDVDLYSDNYFTLVVTNNADNSAISLGIIREVENE